MSRSLVGTSLAWVLVLAVAGCSDSPKKNPTTWPDGSIALDGMTIVDFRGGDLGVPPDLTVDPEAPAITILAPKAKEVIIGDMLKVQATITDKDTVDDQTVQAQLDGSPVVKMTITSTPNVYEALLDVTEIKDSARLWVEAADLTGRKNRVYVDFQRDPGPRILFISPAQDSRHKGSVSIQVVVMDSRDIKSFELRIGNNKIPLQKTADEPKKQTWVGTVKFDDPMFDPPLSGTQVLTATASNANGASSNATRSFVVDDQGPEITIMSQQAGQIIGHIIHVKAQVEDLAGVIPSSVKCVIGNKLDTRTVYLKNSTGTPDIYEGDFDTRTLTQEDLWPVMSFRAADKLGNENHRDIEVALDNGQPIVELDPPIQYYIGRKKDDVWQCSQAFDPVGEDAASDLDKVAQITELRVRIEDQGNNVPSAEWFPIAKVDDSTTRLFVLDDTSKALVVDTDGDGFCDDINPEVVPLGSTPLPGQAVAVNLVPVNPTGSANFMPPTGDVPPGCETWGDEGKPPEPLCWVTPLTVAIQYALEGLPALYTIPPVVAGKGYKCVGLPFDFKANNFSDGWVCAAARADDMLSNRGVSPPIRLYLDLAWNGVGPHTLPSAAGTPPACTGTMDKVTGKIDATKPCKYREKGQPFPQRYPFAPPWTSEVFRKY